MNKSVGLALLALVCLAQVSAALPFSSPYSEAEKNRERLARQARQLDLKMDELHTAIELRKTQRAIAKLRRSQTRTLLQSELTAEERERVQSLDNLADSQSRAERVETSVHKSITEINDEVLRGLGRGRALQVHNIARGINAASKAAVVAGAVTDNKDMMKAGVAATAISGAAKIATRPALGRPLQRAVRKGKRKLRRGVRRALRG